MTQKKFDTAGGVPDSVLDELTELLVEKIDLLLDRATDRALGAPAAGSDAWRSQWLDRGSDLGREHLARRLHVREALARKAGVGLNDVSNSGSPQVAPASQSSPTRRRKVIDDAQLSMF